MEIWKDIKGYEGLYQVSNLGRVRSNYRRVVNHKSGSTRLCAGKLMVAWDNGNGYLTVSLSKSGKRKNHYVHRLVASAFIENRGTGKYINHIDFNKYNNNATNLEWCTQRENVEHSAIHMKHPKSKCKPSSTGVKYVHKRISRGKTIYRVVFRNYGIDKSFKTLEEAIDYRNWCCGGDLE
jgi:hypothetical protein